jgi:Holliday junction resolvasome RuvABC endonuclease subunit
MLGGTPKKILGLDLSLNSTGFCVRDVMQETDIEGVRNSDFGKMIKDPNIHWQGGYGSGVIQWNPKYKLHHYQKGVIIKKVIDELRSCKGGVRVVVEDYAVPRMTGATIKVIEISGMIRYELYRSSGFYAITASALKKFTTGKGQVQKDLMMKEVFRRWEFDVDTSDEADAFALVQVARVLMGEVNPLEFQKEIFKKVEWWGMVGEWKKK